MDRLVKVEGKETELNKREGYVFPNAWENVIKQKKKKRGMVRCEWKGDSPNSRTAWEPSIPAPTLRLGPCPSQ